MEEIVQQVAQRVGIPEDKARMAVDVVVSQLEKRLPGPLAAQLKQHLGGANKEGAGMGDLAKGVGGMLGKQ